MTTEPVFEILWDDIVIGTTLFEQGAPPRLFERGAPPTGVATGHFQANALFRDEHLIDMHRLSARFADRPIPSTGGVKILDAFKEFGDRHVTIFGVGHPLYEELFPHNVAAYNAIFPPRPRTGMMRFNEVFRAAWSRSRRWLTRSRPPIEESKLPPLVVRITSDEIVDWPSFHAVCKRDLRFPTFYGNNMNAWIDCMTDVEQGMTALPIYERQLLVLEVPHTTSFAARCPEQYRALIDACTFVNQRRQEVGDAAIVALLLTN